VYSEGDAEAAGRPPGEAWGLALPAVREQAAREEESVQQLRRHEEPEIRQGGCSGSRVQRYVKIRHAFISVTLPVETVCSVLHHVSIA